MANEEARAESERARRRIEFGLALARARQRSGLSQEALGMEIGSTQSTISSWERGESEPPPDFVFEIERACDGLVPGELSRLLNFRPLQDEDMPTTVESAIMSEPGLNAYQRGLLCGIYHMMRRGDMIPNILQSPRNVMADSESSG